MNPYPRGPRGWGLALVDLTWSLPNTLAGLLYLGAHLLAGHRVDRDTSIHSGQIHVIERVHEAYAMTIGPVVAGATEDLRAHESVHVLQARVLGPLYLPLVAFNYAVFTVAPVWLLYHDHVRWPIRGFTTYFTHGVYPHTFHEVWAFRRSQRTVQATTSGTTRLRPCTHNGDSSTKSTLRWSASRRSDRRPSGRA